MVPSGMNFSGMTMDFAFEVDNPNPIGFTLANLDYQLDLDGSTFLKGNDAQNIALKKNGRSTVHLPLTVEYKKFASAVSSLFSGKDKIPYHLKTGFGIDSPMGVMKIPLNVDGEAPIPKAPDIKVSDVSIGKMGLSGTDMNFKLKVGNNNAFPLGLKALTYALGIANVDVGSGTAPLTDIAANSNGEVNIPVKINFLKMGTAVVQALKSKSLPYNLAGKLDLGDGEVKHPFSLKGIADLKN